jgi:DNA-binding NarL/FixJ family response regulator
LSIRVLIADDHPLVRDGLRFCMERSGRGIKVVAEVKDGLELLEAAETNSVDVFIVDITMPQLNGLDAARELIRIHPSARIIVLSLHDSRVLVEQAIEIGVAGYLTKATASQRIVEAVHEVAAGRFYLSPDVKKFMVENAAAGRKRSQSAKQGSTLTPQERKVLQLISEGHTTKEIAARLERSAHTIRTHRRNLMAKLGIHKETDLVRYAVREGITRV